MNKFFIFWVLLALLSCIPCFASKQVQVKALNAVSASQSVNSDGVDIGQGLQASIQAVVSAITTGVPVGILHVQGSNDIVPVPATGSSNQAVNVVNWTNTADVTGSVAGSGSFLWNLPATGYRWLRLSYSSSSVPALSSSSISAIIMYKGD